MKKLSSILLIFILTFALAACSQNDAVPAPETPSQEQVNDPKSVESIVVSGVLGDVELEEPATRIVALEWTYAEDLLALGVQPVGVSDIENYYKWVNIDETFDDTVAEVGTRQEPSLETIAELQPDLIIAIKFRHESIKPQLEAIAPTVFFDPYPSDENISQYDEMESTFKEIAKAVGKNQEADQVLQELEEKFVEARSIIEAADLATKDVLLTQAFSSNQTPQIRLFTPNALASVILEKMGLNNVHTSDAFEVYGYSSVNVEALTHYENVNYLYVVQDNDNIYENQLKDNKVWNSLDFVQENRTYSLGGDTWLFGGPLSAKVLVDSILASLGVN
jgi:iron complex transport system substrate-binding protein